MIFNWVDWVILAVFAFYIFKGWEEGLLRLGTSLLSFVISLWLAVKFHSVVGEFFVTKFGLPSLWGSVLGYVIIGFGAEAVVGQLLYYFVSLLPHNLSRLKINNFFGAVLSLANGVVIVAFILIVVSALPLKGTVKGDIQASYLGNRIIKLVEKYGGEVKTSLDQVGSTASKFLTIEPQSRESIILSLDRASLHLAVDEETENQMLKLVNSERAKVGIKPLKLDIQLREVARSHSRDMFERGYFSHYDPEGHDAGYRLDQAGIQYTIAGENLAYAPDLPTAHTGLMNSEGHRKNILDPRFTRVGIGVINGGGGNETMFTQDYAD